VSTLRRKTIMASSKRTTPPKPADDPKPVAPTAKAKKSAVEATPAKPVKKAAPKSAKATAAVAKEEGGEVVPAAPPAIEEPAFEAAAAPSPEPSPLPDQAEIDRMIAEAAYYLAEKRNFQPGFEAEDWATAKDEVMLKLRGSKPS
jgi:hypothetical protein